MERFSVSTKSRSNPIIERIITMNTEPEVKVRVTRRFNASLERVLDARLDLEMIDKRMFVPAVREE
jgi:hypothetical protein